MFEWARNYEDLYKILNLFNLTQLSFPKRVCYEIVSGYIQEGPQCGLVALAMACGCTNREFVQNIFDKAKSLGFTLNGEIFSSIYMENLAKLVLPSRTVVNVFEGELNCDEIKEHLLKGGKILVPYDTDKDNSPGLFNGHKAHWAILFGAIETDNDFFVMARHGKAKNIAIWPLMHISQSNSQLNEFSPDRKQSNLEYKVPEGGLNGKMGLKNFSILIKL